MRGLRDYWFNSHVEYMQKINDLSTNGEKAEDYCVQKSQWVMQENDSRWVDCFKKSSNLDHLLSKDKDFECEKEPFMSEKLLKLIT
jgi:hypothetical protein